MANERLERSRFLGAAAAAAAAGLAAPAAAADPRMRRWDQQRWILDRTIEAVGIDWDQGRSSQITAACGVEALGDVAALRARIKKYADFSPAFEAVGRRRLGIAQAAEKAGETVTARDNYFLAAYYLADAQWPIHEASAKNLALNRAKRDAYAAYARLADHHVAYVDIPFGDKALPAIWHLPPGYAGGRIPAIVSVTGMDGFKEGRVALYGDRYLQRGIAVLAVEGPGMWEAPLRGIFASVDGWAKAGPVFADWLLARPEVDPQRIGIVGTSFGSFFSTVAAAAEPRYRAVAVQGSVFEPGCHTIFEEASPTFKNRFMFMAGYTDEAGFDRFARSLSVEGRAEKIAAPYLLLTGESDELSPLAFSERMFSRMKNPRRIVIYQDARHSLGGVPSTALGPATGPLLADWLVARFAGRPWSSERWFVDSAGRVNATPL